jgi:hypothetical protein
MMNDASSQRSASLVSVRLKSKSAPIISIINQYLGELGRLLRGERRNYLRQRHTRDEKIHKYDAAFRRLNFGTASRRSGLEKKCSMLRRQLQ